MISWRNVERVTGSLERMSSENMLECGHTEEIIVNNTLELKLARRAATRKKAIYSIWKRGKMKALLLTADDVVEEHATKTLASSALSQGWVKTKPRLSRAPHLSEVERELAELRKVVAALAIRSVAHEDAVNFDIAGVTVLDADTAYQMLDNPPDPTEALRNLLALR